MTTYPLGVYAHLDITINGYSRDDKDPERELWVEYCLSEGLTEYAQIRPGYGLKYRATAKGQVEFRSRGKQAKESSPQPAVSDAVPDAVPKDWLTGWHAITSALKMKYADREKVKSLNTRFSGPITNKGPGTQPIVDRAKLIDWWDKLDQQQQELSNQQQGRRLSAETTHNFGRAAEVAPEISGSIKKRRKQSKPGAT